MEVITSFCIAFPQSSNFLAADKTEESKSLIWEATFTLEDA
jgi:hypothetical protein